MKKVNKDRADKAVEYVQKNYHILDICEKYGVLDGIHTYEKDRTELMIGCIFHGPDKNPSLGINTDRNTYNCFGCSAGGNIINLLVDCKTKLKGLSTSYYSELEQIVNTDVKLQLQLGFNTIFESALVPLDELKEVRVRSSFKKPKGNNYPKTLLELSARIRKEFPKDIDVILSSFSLMSSGIEPQEIYKLICSSKKKGKEVNQISSFGNFDLSKMIGE